MNKQVILSLIAVSVATTMLLAYLLTKDRMLIDILGVFGIPVLVVCMTELDEVLYEQRTRK